MKDAQTFKEGSEVYLKGKVEKVKGNNLLIELSDGAPNMVVVDFANHEDRTLQPADGNMSDGYHTFNELYDFRMMYNAAFFCVLQAMYEQSGGKKFIAHKSKRHHDGEECFGGGWFVVVAYLGDTDSGTQITNHYEMKHWDLFPIPEKRVADAWDGHTPQDTLERIRDWINSLKDAK